MWGKGAHMKAMLLFFVCFLVSSLALTWWRATTVTSEDVVAAVFVGAFAALFFGCMARAAKT